MQTVEQKALALIAEIKEERGMPAPDYLSARAALIRAIEQHEAFKLEVSDAVVKATHTMAAGKLFEASGILAAFIIAKPDPLVEAWIEATGNTVGMEPLNAAIAKRGGKIVWGEG